MADLNLALEVIALQNGQYRITAHSPETEWTVEIPSPFTPKEQQRLNRFHDAPNDRNWNQEIGQGLFDFLIASHSQTEKLFYDSIKNPRIRLRLLLQAERAGWLEAVPWELMYTPTIGFLALSPKTPIVRGDHNLSLRPPVPVIAPLKVLVTIAAPPNYPYMNVEQEWERLQEATASLRANGLISLERLERATWTALKRRLREQDYQVLHFIGFSQVDVLTGQAFLALEDDSYASASSAVSGLELGRDLGPESTVRLVYMNIREAPPGAPIQLASQVLKSGLGSVVTTQFGMSAVSEQLFTQSFYQPFCEAHPVDAALNVARHALAEQTPNAEWAAPALFLRARDSMLFHPLTGVSGR